MNILGKLKTVKKRWIYLCVAIIVIALAGGIAAAVCHDRFEERNGEGKGISYYQTYYDLLYLENTTDLKISQDQAKVLVPIAVKLSTATDKTIVSDLEKNIYKQLTPQQYYKLINTGNNNFSGKNRNMRGRNKGGFEGGFNNGKGENKEMLINDSIKDVVINMLKAKIPK